MPADPSMVKVPIKITLVRRVNLKYILIFYNSSCDIRMFDSLLNSKELVLFILLRNQFLFVLHNASVHY